ncbi:hypothetical protein [Methylotenera versatilis]|uniref:hypothetical protein n=1 Tax=Methylotenera versatilis TaxID=1055487 RepID=UPI00064559E0|nr:hypothetical protein [Methylotenera versatilis]
MKWYQVIKLLGVGLIMLNAAGCASTANTFHNSISSNKTGSIVGFALSSAPSSTQKEKLEYCEKFNLNDPRCSDHDYSMVAVMSEFGFAKAWTGGFGFAHKSLNLPDNSKSGCGTNGSQDQKCTYVKLQVVPNSVGTVSEVVSRPGDGKCKWGGLPRAGGVVCAGVFDYKTDNQAAVSQ